MGQYVAAIRDRVTTGNAMLALSDAEMDKKLGVTSVLHRRKLRLAIEEQRRPDRLGPQCSGHPGQCPEVTSVIRTPRAVF